MLPNVHTCAPLSQVVEEPIYVCLQRGVCPACPGMGLYPGMYVWVCPGWEKNTYGIVKGTNQSSDFEVFRFVTHGHPVQADVFLSHPETIGEAEEGSVSAA